MYCTVQYCIPAPVRVPGNTTINPHSQPERSLRVREHGYVLVQVDDMGERAVQNELQLDPQNEVATLSIHDQGEI